MTTTTIPAVVFDAARQAGAQVGRRFGYWLTAQDAEQEALLYYIQNAKKFRRIVNECDDEEQEKRNSAYAYLTKSLSRAAERAARKEKAIVTGYEQADEYFYSTRQIEDLLFLYFDTDSWTLAATGNDGPKVSTFSDPAEGFDMPAKLADVGTAYRRLDAHQRQLIEWLFKDRLDPHAVAQWEEVTPKAIGQRKARALRRMQEILGGPSPWRGHEHELDD